MENRSYSKIAGKKTLILIIGLIIVIIILSVYSVFLVIKRSRVLTNSSYFEKPEPTATPTPVPLIIPTSIQKFGD